MSYADIEDLRSRAGRLKGAWDETTEPNEGDLERYLRDASDEIDVALAARGFAVPVTEDIPARGLRVIAADIALLTAMTATWPGGSGPASVAEASAEVRSRVEGTDGQGGYRAQLREGNLPALVYLAMEEQGDQTGASAFWIAEHDYSSWLDDLQSGAFRMTGDGLMIRSPIGPQFHKEMRF